MKSLVYALLILTSFSQPSRAGSAGFTLVGKDKKNQKCFLHVDRYGYDRAPGGQPRFFAEVRTSFDPANPLTLVAIRNLAMVSLDSQGHPSRGLTVSLSTPASVKSLHRARSFVGHARGSDGRFGWFFCGALRPYR